MASLRRPASPSPQATPIPEVTIDGVATTPDAAVSVDIPDNAADEYQKETIRADDATAVLKRQIEALEQSERLQRQHAERQQQHTHAINQLAEHASRTAAEQGHQPGSAEHLNRAREIFHNYLQSQARKQRPILHQWLSRFPGR
jgi:predicted ribosome quality control (RQC) complex YloA/Tae2 family protein